MIPGSLSRDLGRQTEPGDYRNSGGGSFSISSSHDKDYKLDLIFRSVINKTEREFLSALNDDTTGFSKKRLLMIALITARVRISRFISLSRWYAQTPKIEKTINSNNSTIEYSRQALAYLKQTSFYISQNKLPKGQFASSVTTINENENKISSSSTNPFFNLLIQYTPLSVQSIYIKNQTMMVTFDNNSKFKIGSRADNTYYLKGYSLAIRNVSQSTTLLITKLFAKIISSGIDVFRNLEKTMRTIQKNVNLSEFILNISKATNECSFEIEDGNVFLRFPEILAPYNTFTITSLQKGINAISRIPMYEYENLPPRQIIISYTSSHNFLEALFHSSVTSKIIRIYSILKDEVSKITNSIHIELEENNILIKISGNQVAKIYIDRETFKLKFEYINKIKINYSIACHAALYGGAQANMFFKNLLFQYGLSQIFDFCFWESLENFDFLQIPLIHFSSSESIPMQLAWNGSKPTLLIDSQNHHKINPIAYAAVKQLQSEIQSRSNFYYGKFSFTLPNCGKAKLCFGKEGTSWHLILNNDDTMNMENNKTIVVYGRNISSNFTHKIVEIVQALTRFIDVTKQVRIIAESNVLTVDQTEMIVQYCPKYVPSFTLKINGLTHIGDSWEETTLEANIINSPKFIIDFHRFSKTSVYAQQLINNKEMYHRFGSFMGSSLIPLHIFQSVFLEEPRRFDWSLSVLSDDHSFALVFKRYFSMNVMWKLTHYFQAILPVSSISVVLQLALVDFPGFLPAKRFSHPTLRIHTSQLTEFRRTIEEFFSDRDALHHAHFKTKPNSQSNEFEHNIPSSWLHITATMQGGLNYEVEHSSRTAKRIARALEKAPKDRQMMRYRLLFLAKLATYPEQIGDAVAIAIDAISSLPGLEWNYLVRTVFPPPQSESEVITFSAVKFQAGTFKLSMTSHQGSAVFRVESQLPDCGVVTDAETLNDWLELFK